MLSLYIQVIEEEDPASHVMEAPSPSTVTHKMLGDVDPADHIPDSGPPPQVTDQISAVSYITFMCDLVIHSHSVTQGHVPEIVSNFAIHFQWFYMQY